MNNNNQDFQYNLNTIFNLGVERTLYKSHVPDKLNELRKELNLPPRIEPLGPGEYDGQAFDAIKHILGTTGFGSALRDLQAKIVLNIAGSGLITATPVMIESMSEIDNQHNSGSTSELDASEESPVELAGITVVTPTDEGSSD